MANRIKKFNPPLISIRLSPYYSLKCYIIFFGIELTKNSKPAQKEAEEILYHSLSNGLSYKVGGGCILTLCPPMTITEEELNEAFNIIEAGIKEVC